MPVVANVPVIMVAAALFLVIAVGPVVAVVVALFPSIIDAQAVATRICTSYIIEALSFWADPSPKTLLLIHNGYFLSRTAHVAEW